MVLMKDANPILFLLITMEFSITKPPLVKKPAHQIILIKLMNKACIMEKAHTQFF